LLLFYAGRKDLVHVTLTENLADNRMSKNQLQVKC